MITKVTHTFLFYSACLFNCVTAEKRDRVHSCKDSNDNGDDGNDMRYGESSVTSQFVVERKEKRICAWGT